MTDDYDRALDFVRRGMTAQQAIDDVTARKPCPFCGGTKQELLPCEVQTTEEDGSHQIESWHVATCACGAAARAGAIPAAAWLNWNRRV